MGDLRRPFPWLVVAVGVGLLAVTTAGIMVTRGGDAGLGLARPAPGAVTRKTAGPATLGPGGRPSPIGPGARLSTAAAPVPAPGPAPATGQGQGQGGPVPTTAAAQVCAGVCVTVDTARPLGPARLVAQGFIHGVDATTSSALLSVLHPQSWLFEQNEAAYGAARAQNATVTDILSDDWYRATYTPGRLSGVPPWADWKAYGQWVQAYVRSTLADHHVDYWDIQNEPDGPIDGVQPTVNQALLEFAVAAGAIRSVDPSARLMGPSLSAFNDRSGPTLDLSTFLAYVAAQHIRVDAISWHEVGARVSASENPPDPQSVIIDVARMRALLAAHPAVGSPALVINEYASVGTHLIPGWAVGWISALEQAGVSAANRACWSRPPAIPNECFDGGLDGLLVPGSGRPAAVYWVHAAYAQMTGERLPTASPDATVSAFATERGSTVRILVGRHVSCSVTNQGSCAPSAPVPPAKVTLRGSWRTVRVSVQRIPASAGAMASPPVMTFVTTGPIVLPAVADGDAYLVTLVPAT